MTIDHHYQYLVFPWDLGGDPSLGWLLIFTFLAFVKNCLVGAGIVPIFVLIMPTVPGNMRTPGCDCWHC